MEKKIDRENARAGRIALRLNMNHLLLSNIYETLVDREWKQAEKDLREVIFDLRMMLKSIEEDDF